MDRMKAFVATWTAAGRSEEEARAAWKMAVEQGVQAIAPGDRELFIKALSGPDEITFHVPIAKVDKAKREVWGYSTTETVDVQGDLILLDAAEKAYRQHSEEFSKRTKGKSLGTVREMHKDWAAGKLLAWKRDDAARGIAIGCKVVDEKAWEKCEEGVYTMFSIAGKITEAEPVVRNGELVRLIKGFQLRETSLVDSGANLGAVFTMVKSDGAGPAVTFAPLEKVEPAGPPATTQTPAGPRRVVQALLFSGFTKEKAREWARAHRFSAPEPAEVAKGLLRIQQRRADYFRKDEGAQTTVALAKGVQAVLGEPAAAAPARVTELLGAVRKALPSSELSSIFAGLDALAAVARAIDTEVWEAYAKGMSELPPEERAGVLALSDSANTILEWMAQEFAEQARTLAAPGGAATVEALAKVEQLIGIRRALDPVQLRKVVEDEGQAENLTKMHEIGHALCAATMAMGGECASKMCKAEGEEPPAEGEEEAPPEEVPAGEEGEETPPEEEETEKRRPAKGAGRAVLVAVEKVAAAVKDMGGQVTALRQQVTEIGKTPAHVGREARPAEKVIGGASTPTSSEFAAQSEALVKAAESEPNPEARDRLRKRAAELSIRAVTGR